MSYFDILNEFNIKLNEAINNLELDLFLDSLNFKTEIINAYKNSRLTLENIDKAIFDNNSSTSLILDNFRIAREDIDDSFSKDNGNFKNALLFNIEDLKNNFNAKDKQISDENKALDNKIFKISSKSRDKINELDINRNLKNLTYTEYKPNILNKYNYIIKVLTDKKDIKNSQIHSKNSRDLYTFNEAYVSVIDEVQKKIEKYKKSISVINEEIQRHETKANQSLLNIEIELNKEIAKINSNISNKKSINKIQTDIVITAFNDELEQIEQKYNEKKNEILKRLQQNFENIDISISKLNKEHENAKQKIINDNSLKIIKLENIIEQHQEDANSNSLNTSSLKFLKHRNSYTNKNLTIQQSYLSKLLALEDSKYKKALNQLKNKRYYLDLEKTKDLNILNLEKKYEIDKVKSNIEICNFEKKIYEQIEENHFSIEVNNEKLKKDINGLNISSNFKSFEKNRAFSIAVLTRKLKECEAELRFTKNLQQIVNTKYIETEKLDIKLNDLLTILDIERNKYLTKFNEFNIQHHININNLNYDFLKQIEVIMQGKSIANINELVDFNKKCIDNFKDFTALKIEKEKIAYQNSTIKLESKHTYNLSLSKCNLHINKLNLDYNLLCNLTANYNTIVKINNVILSMILKNCYSYLKTHLTNSEKLVKKINNVLNLYIDFYLNLASECLNILEKTIDSRIHFELGSKYDLMIEDINNTYMNKLDALKSKQNSIDETITNYKNGLHKFYKDLQIYTIKRKQAFKKKDSITIKDCNSHIHNLNKLIKKNQNSIDELTQLLLKYPDYEKAVELEKEKQINLILEKKNDEVSINYVTFNRLKEAFSDYKDLLNSLYNSLSFNHIVIRKKIRISIEKFEAFNTKYLASYIRNMNKIIKNLYNHEANNLKKVKSKYYHTYLKNQRVLNMNYIAKMNEFEAKLSDNQKELAILNHNHLANVERIANNTQLALKKNSASRNIEEKKKMSDSFEKKAYYNTLFEACAINSKEISKNILASIKRIEDEYKEKTSLNLKTETNEKNNALLNEAKTKDEAKQILNVLPKALKDEIKRTTNLTNEENKLLEEKNIKLNESVKEFKKECSIKITKESNQMLRDSKILRRKFIIDSKVIKKRKND